MVTHLWNHRYQTCYSQPYDENIANTTMHYIYYCVTYVTASNMKHTWVFKVPNILVWLQPNLDFLDRFS